MAEKLKDTVKKAKKIGEDDPRRVVHSLKVGLALTLVSLFYYFRPLYDGFGQAGMWAILTVVVVFEFSVGKFINELLLYQYIHIYNCHIFIFFFINYFFLGGTISKSLNRGGATLVAASLGVGAEYLANLCGETGEPIVLGLLVFILGN